MELTREETIRNFREHWASLTITGTKDKKEYLERNGIGHIKNNCFLCEFTQGECSECPIDWPIDQSKNPINVLCQRSLYEGWRSAATPEERSKYAALIRDLPEKKEPALRFSPGQKVRVRQDLKVGERYDGQPSNGCYVTDRMGQYRGKEATITEFFANTRYHLDIDGGGWSWSDSMLEPAPRFQVGDKVVPVSKSTGDNLKDVAGWFLRGGKEQGFLFVNKISAGRFLCWPTQNGTGDYFLESDLRPWKGLG